MTQRRIGLVLLIMCIVVATVSLTAYADSAETGSHSAQRGSCDVTVFTVVALNNAIDCFNNETSGDHTITFGSDILISGSGTTAIGNFTDAQLTIDGGNFTLDGNDTFRGLTVNDGNVTVRRLTITRGSSDEGGAIRNGGVLTISFSTFLIDNAATERGGAIYHAGGELAISGAELLSNTAGIDGGGLFVHRGEVAISSTTIEGNSAEGDGGGIHIGFGGHSPTVTFSGCCIDRNSATDGGGVYVHGGNITFSGARIRENTASEKGGGLRISISSTFGQQSTSVSGFIQDNRAGTNGGGIYVSSGTHSLESAFIERNIADEEGGGIFNSRANLTLTDITVFSNTAGIDGGGLYVDTSSAQTGIVEAQLFKDNAAMRDGGGIYVRDGSATITDSVLIENETVLRGGGIHVENGEATVIRSTLYRNSAGLGGGLFAMRGTATISNSTFSSNMSNGDGGGIFINLSDASGTLNHSTVAANSAVDDGGGVYIGAGTLTVHSSIVADNVGTKDCDIGSGTLTVTASLIEATVFNCGVTAIGGNIIGSDPSMASLADNGGPTLTHALQTGSIAINQGDNSTCPQTDQRGFTRPDAFCDMGAYEAMAVPLSVALSATAVQATRGAASSWYFLIVNVVVGISVLRLKIHNVRDTC